MSFEETLAQLHRITGFKPVQKGNWYMAVCPCHNDHRPSLSVTVSERGNTIFKCFAGCNWRDIKRAVFDGHSVNHYEKPYKQKGGKLVAKYVYLNADSRPLYRKLRFDPKGFTIQSYVNNNWVSGMLHKPVLYRLPEVICANTVFILEGEKAVEAIRRWGITATCTYNGASKNDQEPKWLVEYNQYLTGKHVVLLPDNDDPGKAHMQYVYKILENVSSKKIIELPGLAIKADFYDWQEVGWTKDDLNKLII